MGEHAHICLPRGIKKVLQSDSTDKNLKKKFEKAVNNLKVRPYPHGLYIKKLHNVNHILEARLDNSQRLLFDFTSRYCETCRKFVPFTQIMDFVTDHDDVNRKAIRLNREINDSIFESWEKVVGEKIEFDEQEKRIDCTVGKPPSAEEWFVVDFDLLNRLVDEKSSTELRLTLTEEQVNKLNYPGPKLINGSAGSGKTTLGIYYLLDAILQQPKRSALYVTYNNSLLKNSRDLFMALGGRNSLASQPGQPGVYFSTYAALCMDLAKPLSFDSKKEETYSSFRNWLDLRQLPKELSSEDVWNEIRSVLRGSVPGDEIPDQRIPFMLSWKTYAYNDESSNSAGIGKKGSFLPTDQRKKVYAIAEKYQKRLEDNGLYDEMSVTRAALGNSREAIYDVLVVDELQDLTEIQIDLLFRQMLGQQKNIFMTGDLQQVINPSSFRWENVRSLFHTRGWEIPVLLKLNINFRCSGRIVILANQILELRKKKIGNYSEDDFQETPAVLDNQLPFFVSQNDDDMEQVLKGIDIHTIDIIVRTDEIRDHLRTKFETPFVWTIEETKGLEFKDVLLWKLADPRAAPKFTKIKEQTKHEGPLSETAHELNKLYVAVTRARRTLFVFENSGDTYPWNGFVSNVKLQVVDTLHLKPFLDIPITPQDWYERGIYFLQQEQYEQAAKAFQRGGAEYKNKIIEATARLEEKRGRFPEAARLWEDILFFENAAKCWQSAGNYQNAARCWSEIPEYKNAAICFDKTKLFENAGNCWAKSKEYENAAVSYKQAGMFSRAAEMWEAGKKYANAARLWENEQNWRRAAKNWVLAKEYLNGAQAWVKEGHFAQAAVCSRLAEDWGSAAEFWKKAKYVINAAVCFENAGLLSRAAEMWEAGKRYAKAAWLWQNENNWSKAAKNWVLAKEYLKGAQAWAQEGHFSKAAVCYQLIYNWSKAADFWDKAGKNLNAAKCCDKAGNKNKAGKYYYQAGYIREAFERGVKVTLEQQAEIYDQDKKFDIAAKIWQDLQKYEKAAVSWHNCNEKKNEAYCWEQAAGKTKNLEYYSRAEHIYRGLGEKDAARRCEYARLLIDGSDWNKAGEIAWSQNNWEDARKHFGKIKNTVMIQKCDRKIKISTSSSQKQSNLKKQPSKRS